MDIVKRRRLFLINHKSPFIPVKVHNALKGFYGVMKCSMIL